MNSNLQQQVSDDNNNDGSPKTDCSDSDINKKDKKLSALKKEEIQQNKIKDQAMKAEQMIEQPNNQQDNKREEELNQNENTMGQQNDGKQTQEQQNQTNPQENNKISQESINQIAPNQPVQGQENNKIHEEKDNQITPNQSNQKNKNDAIEEEKQNVELIIFSDGKDDQKLPNQQEVDNKIEQEDNNQQITSQKPKPKQQQESQAAQITQEKYQEAERLFLQKLTYQQKQQLQEIQYYVYQDLANVLGVLTDTTETIKHFQNVKDQTYVPIAINKLVLQTNLSNAIHYDCGFNYQDQGLKEMYIREKQHANQIFDEFYQQFDIQNNEKIKECVGLFKYNLTKNPEMKQSTLLKVNLDANFNQSVVQKVFDGMNAVSQTMDKIKEGEYKKLQKEDFAQIIQQRRERAQLLLNQNFPQDYHRQPQPQNNKVNYH